MQDADIIIVGAGLAGLVAAAEAADAGRRVLIIDQEAENSLGGQAYWSFGGLFFINSPLQRFMGIHDSIELATKDWMSTAAFDRAEDKWPRKWAEAYLQFAAGEKYSWLHAQGLRFMPIVNWPERGGYFANGPGNSVPRFHITWGTGHGVLEPFLRRVQAARAKGLIECRFRHKVKSLIQSNGVVTGVSGDILEPAQAERGQSTSRKAIGNFSLQAQAVIIASGGIGGNHDLVRQYWPERMGPVPKQMLCGVPDYVDGSMFAVAAAVGANLINADRMWHYPEGVKNFAPVWPRHAIRILSGPTPLWLDATGKRLPAPLFPGFDALGTLKHICRGGHDYSWFILNKKIMAKEFALSGSEQNPDLTSKSYLKMAARVLPHSTGPVQKFQQYGEDFITRDNLDDLIREMNALSGAQLLDAAVVRQEIIDRDLNFVSGLGKDVQLAEIYAARRYLGDKLLRVTAPAALLDPKDGPLIAVRLRVLTRKTLGGLEADLEGRVLHTNGSVIPGLYTAGEVSGFGGGGYHGYRALEGTFLGGCIFSGRTAGRAAAAAVI